MDEEEFCYVCTWCGGTDPATGEDCWHLDETLSEEPFA